MPPVSKGVSGHPAQMWNHSLTDYGRWRRSNSVEEQFTNAPTRNGDCGHGGLRDRSTLHGVYRRDGPDNPSAPVGPAGQPHNCRDANAAPSASASNSDYMMAGCTLGSNAPCENPQSVPAITFSLPSRKACRSTARERQAIVDPADLLGQLLLQDVGRGGTGDDADDVRHSFRHYLTRNLLVDDFENIAPAEYELVTRLIGHEQSVTVATDPDQRIYDWRGLLPDPSAKFAEDYPNATRYEFEVSSPSPKPGTSPSPKSDKASRSEGDQGICPYVNRNPKVPIPRSG